MKVDTKLSKIYLQHRVDDLSLCYHEKDGFNHHLRVVLQYLQLCGYHQKDGPYNKRPTHKLSISLDKLASYTSKLRVHLPKRLLVDNEIFQVISSIKNIEEFDVSRWSLF
jgi:hypothetical protein